MIRITWWEIKCGGRTWRETKSASKFGNCDTVRWARLQEDLSFLIWNTVEMLKVWRDSKPELDVSFSERHWGRSLGIEMCPGVILPLSERNAQGGPRSKRIVCTKAYFEDILCFIISMMISYISITFGPYICPCVLFCFFKLIYLVWKRQHELQKVRKGIPSRACTVSEDLDTRLDSTRLNSLSHPGAPVAVFTYLYYLDKLTWNLMHKS